MPIVRNVAHAPVDSGVLAATLTEIMRQIKTATLTKNTYIILFRIVLGLFFFDLFGFTLSEKDFFSF